MSATRESVTGMALPPALTAVIERVIHGTRLWPSEKRDVRAELESHFREGLVELADEGLPLEASIQILSESFGNPDLAAKLIRRGKKRGRPMIWKAAISVTTALFGVALAGGGYAAYLKFAKPNPSVDYLQELNEPVELTPVAQRAWPVLRDALLAFEPMPRDLEILNGKSMLPGDAKWPQMHEWIEKNRTIITGLRDAVSRPYYGFVYGGPDTNEFLRALAARNQAGEWTDSGDAEEDPLAPKLIGVLLPHLAEVRGVSYFLTLNARDLASQGQWEQAWDSLDLCNRLGMKLFEGKTLIEQLVGASVVRLAENEMLIMLTARQGLISPSEIRQLASSSFVASGSAEVNPHLEGERLMFADVVQYVFTDDGKGNGRLIPSQFHKVRWMGEAQPAGDGVLDGVGEDAGLYAMAAQHADRIETLQKYDELWREMERLRSLPLYDRDRDRVQDVIDELNKGENATRYALIGLMCPNLNHADRLIRECAMYRQAINVVIAMSRYRSDHGEWPAAIESLVPGYLDAVPEDIYNGKSLRYVRDEAGQPTLYSIGRNMIDDHGSAEKTADSDRPENTQKQPADMVFYPVSRD